MTSDTEVFSRSSTPRSRSALAAYSRSVGVERRKHLVGHLDQHDVGAPRIEFGVDRRHRVVAQFGQRTGHLDAGRTGADDDDRQVLAGVGRGRVLEVGEDLVAQLAAPAARV